MTTLWRWVVLVVAEALEKTEFLQTGGGAEQADAPDGSHHGELNIVRDKARG